MLFQSDGRLPLLDVVLRVEADQDEQLHYWVKLVDRYQDGPAVPSVIAVSPDYPSLDEAMAWARKAVETFRERAEP